MWTLSLTQSGAGLTESVDTRELRDILEEGTASHPKRYRHPSSVCGYISPRGLSQVRKRRKKTRGSL